MIKRKEKKMWLNNLSLKTMFFLTLGVLLIFKAAFASESDVFNETSDDLSDVFTMTSENDHVCELPFQLGYNIIGGFFGIFFGIFRTCSKYENNADFVDFYIIKSGEKDFQKLQWNDAQPLSTTNLQQLVATESRTTVIVHGYCDDGYGWIKTIGSKEANLASGTVILVNYGKIACCSYAEVASRIVFHVAEHIANVLEKLNVKPENVHMIGHSLGAHISGAVGRIYGGKIGHITGLDPAGPLYDNSTKTHLPKLSKDCAQYVRNHHTSTEFLGTPDAMGHTDLYYNDIGGRQPGCSFWSPICSHSWVIYLFFAYQNGYTLSCFRMPDDHTSGYQSDTIVASDITDVEPGNFHCFTSNVCYPYVK